MPGTRHPTPAARTRPPTTLPHYEVGAPLAQTAGHLSQILLRDDLSRWSHTCAVVGRAGEVAGVLPARQRALLLAAAWLHDVGYSPVVQQAETEAVGFHPLTGAGFLAANGWPADVATLVAHHSAATVVAGVLGLQEQFAAHRVPGDLGPVVDALTWADQTTGPGGQPWTLEQRLADGLRRHGEGSPNARAHPERAPALRAAVERVERARGVLASRD